MKELGNIQTYFFNNKIFVNANAKNKTAILDRPAVFMLLAIEPINSEITKLIAIIKLKST